MKILDLFRFCLILCVALCLWGRAEAAIPPARLDLMRPVVQFKTTAASNVWRTASESEPLRYGYFVRVLGKGKVQLVFNNGTQIALLGGTQIQIVSPPSENTPLVVRVFGALGNVFVIAKGQTEIRTASGTAAVRGTRFFVRLDSENQTTVTVTEGKVAFFNEVDDRGVLLSVNETSTATPTTAPTAPRVVSQSGIEDWPGEVSGLPLPFEWPFANPRNNGERLFNQRRFGEAAMELEGLVSNSNDARDWAALGRAQIFEGDKAKAAASYAQALALNPPVDVSNDAALAASVIKLGQEDSKLNGENLKAQEPGAAVSPLFPVVQALADLQVGDSKAAIQHLVGQAGFQAKTLMALALVQENELAAADATAREAVQLAPNSPSARGALSVAAFFRGDTRTALREANQGVKLDPLSPLALLALSRVEMAAGQTDEARSAIAQAAALAPELPLLQVELGVIETRLDHLPSAEKAFRRALAKAPNDARALGGLATVVARQGRKEEAKEIFAKAIEINPNDANIRAQYAGFLVEIGDLKAARLTAEELLATQKADTPTVGALLIRLSEACLFLQQVPDAFEFAQRAVGLLPRSALAHYQWGRVYFEQGRITQAQNQFRIATQLDQELARARYALGLTQEIRASGQDSTSPLGQSSAALESSQAASIIANLQTPGATERVQASVQDPTVARTASRSFGNGQLDGAVGSNSFSFARASLLLPSDDNRTLFGVNAERNNDEGIRDNAGNELTRGGLLFGRKSKYGPSGFWGFAQTQKTNPGQDFGIASDPYYSGLESERKLSTTLLGYNLQNKESQRTRFLFGIDRFAQDDSDAFQGVFARKVRSYHGEVRHDMQLDAHRVSVGLSLGRRSFDSNDFAIFPPPAMRSLAEQDYDMWSLYARDVWQPNSDWRITGEIKGVRLRQQSAFANLPVDPLFPPFSSESSRSKVLPNLLVERYFGTSTNVRLRARRVMGTFIDFDLLAPNDVFLFSASEDYLPRIGLNADAYDLEVDHTFKDGSFARLGAFRRNIDGGAIKTTGLSFVSSQVDGLTFGYEGLLNRKVSYFFNAQWLRGKGDLRNADTGQLQVNERIGGVPQFQTELGTQYLSDSGFFVQPSLAYIGSRDVYRLQGADFVSSKDDSTVVANMRIGKRWGLRSVVYGEVVNLFNKNYSTGSDYIERRLPGRQFRIGGSIRF